MGDADLTLDIRVNGRVLPQYAHSNGRRYVEVDLETPVSYRRRTTERTPYGDEERNDPVTPYALLATNRTAKPCWLELYVDGARICDEYIGPAQKTEWSTITIDGKRRELLFCWPRFPQKDDAAANGAAFDSPVGSIEARLYHCDDAGYVSYNPADPNDCSGFLQANKDAARHAGTADASGPASTTAPGRVLGPAQALHGACEMWDVDERPFATEKVHYRERWALRELGLAKPRASAQPDAHARAEAEGESLQQHAAKRAKPSAPATSAPALIDLTD